MSTAGSSTAFWRIINKYRLHYIDKEYINLDGWYDYFVSTNSKLESISFTRESLIFPVVESNPFLESHISLDEVLISLNKCKNNKASGADSVSFEFLKNLPINSLEYLTYLFNRILEKEEMPSSWSNILLRMIFKKGDRVDPANYRHIALVNCITKVFTQILAGTLSNWVEDNKLLDEWQAGFRRGRSTTDHIFTLNAMIQIRLSSSGAKLFVLFINFRSAFPSVSHGLLWEKLHKLGLEKKIFSILKDLYGKANIAVKGREGISVPVRVRGGVLQGEVMSPILFCLFIADFKSFLIQEGVRGVSVDHLTEILLLAYADDIAVN